MPAQTNRFNQPIGTPVECWHAANRPQAQIMHGQYCDIVPLHIELHVADLYAANSQDDGSMWTYLPYGPFVDLASYQVWLSQYCTQNEFLFYAIIDKKTLQAIGLASYLRIDPANGSIEIGHIAYSPQLQRTTIATEAMYLMAEYVFSLGYRRYEWKCNALNAPSCRAAERLGFKFEGIFRQAAIVKGLNRDTAWYSIIDTEWLAFNIAFQAWLAPSNFDVHGQQLTSLAAMTASILHR